MEKKSSSELASEVEIGRQSAGYTPSVWSDYFIRNAPPLSSCNKTEDWMRQRVAELVRDVKDWLSNETTLKYGQLELLELIDSLQRLGVGYHFEDEMDIRLKGILINHNSFEPNFVKIHENDLHAVALEFRLLRQHGYRVTSDVFNIYKDDEGNFKSALAEDVRGLLSLYEACFWGAHDGDDILDDALIFAKHHLLIFHSEWNSCHDSSLKKLVSHALERPLHRRIPRLEARHYITFYEEDKEHKNDTILELAKLDFYLLQLIHYEEVKSISIWWNEIVQAKRFSFARDRIVECYIWILSVYFEPQYALARNITVKTISLLSITDDIYDVYGTFDELHSFTEVIQRWDAEAAEQLNKYMKLLFFIFDNFFQELEDDLSSYGKSYCANYLKHCLKDSTRAYLQEAKWRDEGFFAPMDEYMKLAILTTSYNTLCCAAFIGMGEVTSKEVLEWVVTFPMLTQHACTICRLRDDIVSQELEQKRSHVFSAVNCYMKEHNTTFDQACKGLLKMVENEWKYLNQEYYSLSKKFPKAILMRVFNFARYMETAYDGKDKYTEAGLNDYISLALVEPILF